MAWKSGLPECRATSHDEPASQPARSSHGPRNVAVCLRVWERNVAIVASAKKCHTNEKSISEGVMGRRGKVMPGGRRRLHLLKAQPKQRRKNFNRKSFYLLVVAASENPQQVKLALLFFYCWLVVFLLHSHKKHQSCIKWQAGNKSKKKESTL